MTGWTAIIPVKPWALAKSRLAVAPRDREILARAFSLDVLECVAITQGVARVVVVSAELEVRVRAQGLGVSTLVDRPLVSRASLNDAIRLGRSWALRSAPDDPVVVVPADLPALSPQALHDALGVMPVDGPSFVPDAAGTGTTLLGAGRPELLRPEYGPGSARRHATAGGVTVIDVAPGVRQDVDTIADLRRALRLGVGEKTHAVAAGPSWARDVNGTRATEVA